MLQAQSHQAAEARRLRPVRSGTTLEMSDITGEAARLPDFDDHERIWLGRDVERGLTAIVAVHDTTLGPALGGTRVWPHADFRAALTDALRLSRGMTYKAAVTGLSFGGGKAVILADPKTGKDAALLDAYAEMLAALNGQYFTGEDVGLTLADADYLKARTPNVTGTTIGGSGNPSPVTARGVFLGIKAALKHRRGTDSLTGVHVAVQGLGSVGMALCEMLNGEGAALTVADIDAARTARAASRFSARIAGSDTIARVEADVFAPCALGGGLSKRTIPSLGAGIVAGAANNQLLEHDDARLLADRGVLYAPDYVINAGGLINVAAELAEGGYDGDDALAQVARIPATLTAIFERAQGEGRTTEEVAADIAMERIARARGRRG
jgi:leucine dehydrogenase